ncbi:MAG: hypothetical protein R3E98_15755 [Gemmatimonadota bacterium]|nr:hypothetical protein [Gemmatimonadota bacterium]
MEWDFIAPMVVAVVFIVTTGGVLLLRPILKPLVRLFEAMIREKERASAPELGRIRELLETLDGRMSLLEERQQFYESLRAEEARPALPAEPTPAPHRSRPTA